MLFNVIPKTQRRWQEKKFKQTKLESTWEKKKREKKKKKKAKKPYELNKKLISEEKTFKFEKTNEWLKRSKPVVLNERQN